MPDTPQYNELASYFRYSPNTLVAGCLNTHEHTDGVVFPGIEPMEDAHCFVGRESIISAMAVLYDTTPQEILDKIEGSPDLDRVYVKSLEDELKYYKTRWLKMEKIIGG